MYSTCSLADEENDGVVVKLLAHRRHGAGLRLASPLSALELSALAPLLAGVTRTKCGALMLPDRSRFGPLYWAVIERDAAADAVDEADDDESDDDLDGGDLADGQGEDDDDDGTSESEDADAPDAHHDVDRSRK